MYRLAYRVITAKGKGHVGDTAGYQCSGQCFLDITGGFNEFHCVIIVLFYPCRHGKDVGVKDNIAGVEIRFVQ